jgi:hypothetical protein
MPAFFIAVNAFRMHVASVSASLRQGMTTVTSSGIDSSSARRWEMEILDDLSGRPLIFGRRVQLYSRPSLFVAELAMRTIGPCFPVLMM